MDFKALLQQPVEGRKELAHQVYKRSVEVIKGAQFPGGGTGASQKGSRYYGHTYPRDHSYTTRAFIAAGMRQEANNALRYILTVETSPEGVLSQRYDQEQKSSSNKPPQIDGNALTLVAVCEYVQVFEDADFATKYHEQIKKLVDGLLHNLKNFPKGSLVRSINAINEFSPYEEGFELYTNACTARALLEAGELLKDAAVVKAGKAVLEGMENYLNIPAYGGLMTLVRDEPNPSVTNVANLTGFLAVTDFDLYPVDSEIVKKSLKFHLDGTVNNELGGYNRYAASIGRHNFGNGPWPMVQLRLADYYLKAGDTAAAEQLVNWVLRVAQLNEDIELGLPEHVVTREEIEREFEAYSRTLDITKRTERKGEYEKQLKSKMMEKYNVGYPINPLVWSHSMFVIVWKNIEKIV